MRGGGSSVLGNLWDTIMAWVLLIAGIALIIGVGYVAYGIFFAPESLFATAARGAGAADPAQVMRNLELACMLITIAAVLVTVAGLARYWMAPETGAVLLLVGAGFLFGMPFLIHSAAINYSAQGPPPAEGLLTARFSLVGIGLAAVGGLQLLIHGVLALASRAGRKPRVSTDVSQGAFSGTKTEKQDKFLGPCWSLPFCRDSAKRVCPVLHRKRPCWRDGRGCYCDQNIVLMLSGDRGRSATRSAQGFVSMQSLSQTRPKTTSEKRAQCLGCPIYLHRQNQKYRVLAPTVVAAVAAFFLLNKPLIDAAYPETILNLGRALRGFSFTAATGPTRDVPEWAQNLAGMPTVEWVLMFVAGMLLVSYLIHGVEWSLYKLGI